MNSRIRKQVKSYENYEQVIEKHLNDDFDVYEYLAQNNLNGYNIGEYSKLYNSMLVTKNDKRKKLEALKVNYGHMVQKQMDSSLETLMDEIFDGDYTFDKVYNDIAAKVSIEFKVKDTLSKEIVEVKKSIDLLKGDIGHLVDRNESAKLLESKMNKVKIVADDQLKRVSLAYLKDKEEVNIRSDMQRKFAKKIKNANMHEDTSLNHMKKTYLDAMLRKKQIHGRLSEISQVNASIQESGEKERHINRKNQRILTFFKYFNILINLISQIKNAESSILENYSEQNSVSMCKIYRFMDWFNTYKSTYLQTNEQSQKDQDIQISGLKNLNLKFPSNEKELSEVQSLSQNLLQHFEEMIIKEYNRITQNMDANRIQYNLQAKKSEDLITVLEIHTIELQKIEMSFCREGGRLYQFTPEMRQEYSMKLKSFGNTLKTIFTFLEYIEKKFNYSNSFPKSHFRQMTNLSSTFTQSFVYRNTLSSMNKSASFETLNLKISPIQGQVAKRKESQIVQQKNYASEFYHIHCSLIGLENFDEQKQEDLSVDIYSNLTTDIEKWFKSIKNSFLHKNESKLHSTQPGSDYFRLVKQSKANIKKNSNLTTPNLSDKMLPQGEQIDANELIQENDREISKSAMRHTIHHPDSSIASPKNNSKRRYMKTCSSINRSSDQTQNKIFNVRKLNSSTQHTTVKDAQRIQLLQDIDQHYYKMIKSTLKMEKENTRRNYLFLKNFKRSKYSSRDSILEQKRFQVSFSMLFSAKKNGQMKEKSQIGNRKVLRKSQISSLENLQRRFSKFITPCQQVPQAEKNKMRLPDFNPAESRIQELKQSCKNLKTNKNVHANLNKSRFSTNSSKQKTEQI